MTTFAEQVIASAKLADNSSFLSQQGGDSLLQLVDKLDSCSEGEIFKDFQGLLAVIMFKGCCLTIVTI